MRRPNIHASTIITLSVPFRCRTQTLISTLVEIYRLSTGFTYLLKVSGYEDYFFNDDIPLPSYMVGSLMRE